MRRTSCPKCQSSMLQEDNFCSNCGYKASSEVSRKKRIFFTIFGALVVLFLLEEPVDKPTISKKKFKPSKSSSDSLYSKKMKKKLEVNYALAKQKFLSGEYSEAKEYIEQVRIIDPKYKQASSLHKSITESLEMIARQRESEYKKREQAARQNRVQQLLERTRLAIKDKQYIAAKNYLTMIYELDPENELAPPLELELKHLLDKK